MNTKLTTQQIEAYRRDGFVACRGLLDADEVAELKAAVLASARAMGDRILSEGDYAKENKETYRGNVFTQRVNLWRINEVAKRYMLSPELGRMVCELGGASGYRVWHDQALIKEPFGNPTAWHLDNPYWSFYSREAISVWIALEDATLGNGCMWFIPGTQRLARYDNVGIGQNLADLFRVYPEMAEIDPVPVEMKAGDCSFHNGLTAHGAGANMTRRRRVAMTCAYMPVGSTFNGKQNVLPMAYFESLSEGDVLANDDWNPVVCER